MTRSIFPRLCVAEPLACLVTNYIKGSIEFVSELDEGTNSEDEKAKRTSLFSHLFQDKKREGLFYAFLKWSI